MENPNYYSITPAEIRYSKKLSANAKLIYGEISALTSKKGHCYAANKYFADLYGKDLGTVSRWISELEKAGFIKSKVDKKNGNKRTIVMHNLSRPIRKNA